MVVRLQCGPCRHALFGGNLSAIRDHLPGQRQQAATVLDGVLQWVETADQERRDAEVVVVTERLGHLVRCADQARGVAARAGEQRRSGPQPLVQPLALRSSGEQAARSLVGRLARSQPGLGAQFDDPLLDRLGACPGRVFGRRQDWSQREAEAYLAPVACRGRFRWRV